MPFLCRSAPITGPTMSRTRIWNFGSPAFWSDSSTCRDPCSRLIPCSVVLVCGSRTELLHHLVARQCVEGAAHLVLGNRLLELHAHQSAARKVDAEGHTLRGDHRRAGGDDGRR